MFFHSRRSTAPPPRGSYRPSDKNKVPIPVSLTLFNFVAQDFHNSRQQEKWFRPQHTSSLLKRVQLQVITTTSSDGRGEETEEEHVVYSGICEKTVHPSWDHLDERIEHWNTTDVYLRMKMRILLLQDDTDDNQVNNTPLVELPAHPRHLRRLGGGGLEHSDDNNKSVDNKLNSSNTGVPETLPINAVLVYYSDGSTRVSRDLYELLSDQQLPEDKVEEFSRFDHDVFQVLDPVTPSLSSANTNDSSNNNTTKTTLQESKHHATRTINQHQTFPQTNQVHSKEDCNSTASSTVTALNQQHIRKSNSYTLQQNDTAAASSPRDPATQMELQALQQQLQDENDQLEALLRREEMALQQELQQQTEQARQAQTILSQITKIQQETNQIKEQTQETKYKCRQAHFLQQARQIKLVRELSSIYPIVVQPNQYQIRGIGLPTDIHQDEEDQVSAALGYLCHLITMLSKYLMVPLRFRLFCNSSRSAIQEDGAAVFPLFRARMVERDQLDRGMQLLEANVECLLTARGTDFEPQSHILVKTQRIYDSVLGGN